MNGPSSTRNTSAALALAKCPPRAVATAKAKRILIAVSLRQTGSAIVVGDPRRDLAVDPLLQLDNSGSHERKHEQCGKNFFGLQHLAGRDQQIAHTALARAADHFRGHDEDDRNAHAELQPREYARHGRGNHDLELDLPDIGAKILGGLNQPTISLPDTRKCANDDRKERRYGADHDPIRLAAAQPNDQEWDQRNLRQRIECGNPYVGYAVNDTRHSHQEAKRDSAHCRERKANKDPQERDAEVILHGAVDDHAPEIDGDSARRRKQDGRDAAPAHHEFPDDEHGSDAQWRQHIFQEFRAARVIHDWADAIASHCAIAALTSSRMRWNVRSNKAPNSFELIISSERGRGRLIGITSLTRPGRAVITTTSSPRRIASSIA